MTDDDLAAIARRDAAVRVYRDKFGGEYVLSKDGRIFGAHACLDRRRLLNHIQELRGKINDHK